MATALPTFDTALYVRVSTSKKEQAESPENQIDIGYEVAKRKSAESGEIWNIQEHLIYRDTGTGTLMATRDDVRRMIRDAERGLFKRIIFKSIARFARDTEDALHMLRRLLAAKVRVISHAEGYDSSTGDEFIFTIHAGVAQQVSEKISIDTRLANFAKARRGEWTGKAPDGYVVSADKHLALDPSRESAMQRLFFLARHSMLGVTKIAEKLNGEGYRTNQGLEWNRNLVLKILRNPAYKGDVVYGKTVKEYYYDSEHRRRSRYVANENPDEIVVTADAHPAYVTEEDYAFIQDLIDGRRKTGGPAKFVYLLRGILRCGYCGKTYGGRYSVAPRRVYRCVTKNLKGATACSSPIVDLEEIERFVVENVVSEVRRRVSGDSGDVVTLKQREDVKALEREVSQLQAEKQTVVDQSLELLRKNMAGEIPNDLFTMMSHTLQEQMKEKDTLVSGLQLRISKAGDSAARNVRVMEAVEALFELNVFAEENREAGRKMLGELVESVTITPDGELVIDWKINFE